MLQDHHIEHNNTIKVNNKLELAMKLEEIEVLLKNRDDLKRIVSDQTEEIICKDSQIADLEIQFVSKNMTDGSFSSLADELDFANDNLKKEMLEKDLKAMKVRIVKIEKSRKYKTSLLIKLQTLSNNRMKELSHLRSIIEKLKASQKSRCRYG